MCAGQLLLAVTERLNEQEMTASGHTTRARRRLAGTVERRRQRKGLLVARAIAGDPGPIAAVLRRPPAEWARAGTTAGPAEGEPMTGWFPVTRDRVRWQARTASWQAAYNVACVYAVLVRQGLAGEEQVVASLRRVVSNRDSGLERPHDWISNDPEFAPLLRRGAPYPKVRAFLTAQERRDYPVRQTTWHGAVTAQPEDDHA